MAGTDGGCLEDSGERERERERAKKTWQRREADEDVTAKKFMNSFLVKWPLEDSSLHCEVRENVTNEKVIYSLPPSFPPSFLPPSFLPSLLPPSPSWKRGRKHHKIHFLSSLPGSIYKHAHAMESTAARIPMYVHVPGPWPPKAQWLWICQRI